MRGYLAQRERANRENSKREKRRRRTQAATCCSGLRSGSSVPVVCRRSMPCRRRRRPSSPAESTRHLALPNSLKLSCLYSSSALANTHTPIQSFPRIFTPRLHSVSSWEARVSHRLGPADRFRGVFNVLRPFLGPNSQHH